jgi:1,4-alpha-glucan branching enzyme
MNGTATFVLHTHLPYCRLAGRWPHGEEWLHEAMLECYVPLVRAFQQLATDGIGPLGVTMNITPILAEQLADATIREHFRDYMAGQIGRAQGDLHRFKQAGDPRASTAAFHLERYVGLQGYYERELAGDLLHALADLEACGALEIATSAATHAYLPLLSSDDAVRFQIETGMRSHRRLFGRGPRAFWLPECAYRPGLEEHLEAAGVRVFFAETHLVAGGQARGKTAGEPLAGMYRGTPAAISTPVRESLGSTFEAYTVGQSDVAVLARNERTGMQVWSAAHGYPGDSAYREFHKKDDQSGLRYWRVTGADVGLGEKDLYGPRAAAQQARQHAQHFHGVVREELGGYEAAGGDEGILVSAYDTELFGHWWLEGVQWLATTIRILAADPEIRLATASEAVAEHPPARSIALPEGSWGEGGDARTWMNDRTRWMWDEIAAREQRARTLLGVKHVASQQLARELLLLQSSDWEFLVTTGQATEYANGRFREHAQRFDALAGAMEADAGGLDALANELFALDNPFPDIDPAIYAGGPGMGQQT